MAARTGAGEGYYYVPKSPATISIVDDDVWTRDGLYQLVESLGYAVQTFESAEHFLSSGFVDGTTCLITDIHMPGLSGFDLQEQLQIRGYRTPVIFITAFPEERYRKRALSSGASGFLSKPFEEQSLIDCLDLAINALGDDSVASRDSKS
jgi:FixJ family two-component response regulator